LTTVGVFDVSEAGVGGLQSAAAGLAGRGGRITASPADVS